MQLPAFVPGMHHMFGTGTANQFPNLLDSHWLVFAKKNCRRCFVVAVVLSGTVEYSAYLLLCDYLNAHCSCPRRRTESGFPENAGFPVY